MNGLLVTEILVPEPWGNPDGPYSKFHDVSEPPAVQEISALDVPTFDAIKKDGGGHVGACLISK